MNYLVEQIRKKQDEIILMVNSSFDEIIKEWIIYRIRNQMNTN